MDNSGWLWLAGILGSVFGLIATAKNLTTPRHSRVLIWFHRRIITASHSWITVIHELGHWFFGLPTGILVGRFLPRITFDDSHNAQTMMPMIRGPLRWVLHPIYAFGGYLSPVLLGGVFVWISLKGHEYALVAEIILIVLAVVMLLGSRSLKTFLFCLYPIFIASLNGYLLLQSETNPSLVIFSNAFILFLGCLLLVGGLGDILIVNGYAINPRTVRFFYGTDFGLLTGWSSSDKGGDPSEEGWRPRPIGPFFFPHVALLVFDILTAWIVFNIASIFYAFL